MTLVLIGGLVSLASALAVITLQHWFDLREREHEARRYPAEVLFNKQVEFYDRAVKVLPEVNGYITTVDVWLAETSVDAKRKAQEYAERTAPVWELKELMETYSMYLPKEILQAGNELFTECTFLPNLPTLERTQNCTELLFSLQNTMRQCAGADKMSTDLLRAFGTRGGEKKPKESLG